LILPPLCSATVVVVMPIAPTVAASSLAMSPPRWHDFDHFRHLQCLEAGNSVAGNLGINLGIRTGAGSNGQISHEPTKSLARPAEDRS
jgi:hypothetical protein